MNELPYTVSTWCGHTQYRCNCCQFDSLSEAALLRHYAAEHAARRLRTPNSQALATGKSDRGVRSPEPAPDMTLAQQARGEEIYATPESDCTADDFQVSDVAVTTG